MDPNIGLLVGAVGTSFGIAMTIAKITDKATKDEVNRTREHVHDHASTLTSHHARISVVESAIGGMEKNVAEVHAQNSAIIKMLRNGHRG